HDTVALHTRWCSGASTAHSAQSIFGGVDGSGNAVTATGQIAQLAGAGKESSNDASAVARPCARDASAGSLLLAICRPDYATNQPVCGSVAVNQRGRSLAKRRVVCS